MLISQILFWVEHITAHKTRISVVEILFASFIRTVKNGVLLFVGLFSIDVDEFVVVDLRALLGSGFAVDEVEFAVYKRGTALH